MDDHQHLPDINRMSVLAATILLAYALAAIIKIPAETLDIPLPGVVFYLTIDFNTIVSILTAALAAVGADWLLRSHPNISGRHTLQHWLLPGLTAWILGAPLSTLSFGPQWWVVFTLGGMLLVMVLLAEYIVVDLTDERAQLAGMGLTAVSYALFLFFVIALRGAGPRLYSLIPAVGLAIGLVSLRTLYLHLEGRWCLTWAVGITMAVAQIAAGLHYWNLTPLEYGLAVSGPAYALITLAISIEKKQSWRTIWIEPALMLSAIWGLAFMIKG